MAKGPRPKSGKRAKHTEAKMREKRMFKEAKQRSSPVTISYLPGYGPEGKIADENA